jgi:hypothetical protein
MHAGSLGDCVLTIHLAQAMKSAWGDPSIAMLARSSLAQWARRRGLLSEAYSFEQLKRLGLYDPSATLPSDGVRFLQGFDLIVSFLGGPDHPVSTRLQSLAGPGVLAIDPRPLETTISKGIHITQQWADQLAHYEHPPSVANGAVAELSPCERQRLHERLAGRLGATHGRVALFHPGSGGLDKCCPLDSLERLLQALAGTGWNAGWMIGPDEVERFGPSYRRRLETTAPVIFEESVEAAADLICGATAYFGNDAGMTHVAVLCGVRTIALFGPTDPRIWRPLGDSCRVIRLPESYPTADAWVADILRQIDAGVSCTSGKPDGR